MSKHVIIYMPIVGEDTVQWAVSDDKGRLTSAVEQGSLSDAAAMVDGRRATLVLAAGDVLLAETVVPGGSAARALQAVPYALEEQVADDVDTLHFALGAKGRDDIYPVAVVGRQLMDTVTDQCRSAGLRVTEIVPETLALPLLPNNGHDSQTWTALLDRDNAVFRLNDNKGFATDTGMASLMLDGACQGLPENEEVALVVFHTGQEATLTVPEQIDMEMRPCDHRIALYATGLASAVHINLLQGGYNPNKNFDRNWKPWRWTMGLAACLCAALFAGKWFDVWQLEQQEAQLDSQIAVAFEKALPGKRLQRPRSQIQSALDGLGVVNNDGFTNRLSQVAASLATQPQTQLKTIGYRKGRFDLDLTTDAVPTLDALKSELAKRGSLSMSVQSANREKNVVRGRVRIE